MWGEKEELWSKHLLKVKETKYGEKILRREDSTIRVKRGEWD